MQSKEYRGGKEKDEVKVEVEVEDEVWFDFLCGEAWIPLLNFTFTFMVQLQTSLFAIHNSLFQRITDHGLHITSIRLPIKD